MKEITAILNLVGGTGSNTVINNVIGGSQQNVSSKPASSINNLSGSGNIDKTFINLQAVYLIDIILSL